MRNPTFHYIVVVDVEGYGRRLVPVQASLRTAMYEVTENAFEDAGLDWESVVKLDRGDGILMLVPPTADGVTLAGKFVIALHESLREKAGFFSAEHQMRMRVALHQGTCQQDRNGWVGEAINTAARLVDAGPLRAALASAPAATMAFIASDDIYRSVIRHGFRHIDTASFAPVEIDMKELQETAWVQIPGYPHPPHLNPQPAPAPAPQPSPAGGERRTSAGVQFHGPLTFGGDQVIGHKTVHGNEYPR
ncbi:adenylate/guanylate cyclase domain-containing protein [Winogradskya humida]|uniref:Guanylate cyclase domain-containing protein n=1 Tax=Winogradskya humida TaxID=113566 RepID=A0ABQ4A0H2_9ACTN|nr:adenylate/guanylate cyclase domain-containing protein [Actinoplanes humidus]GIE23842.1 hypothetical protein Ahu01nite_069440 [Actinoplanes humidus]